MKRNFTIKQYITLFSMLFLFLGISIQGKAKVIYVDGSAEGKNDGTSWADAFSLVQYALDDAISGDEIWISWGTYKPSNEIGGTGYRYKTFQMVEGVGIYGGFRGVETSKSQRVNYGHGETYETILSGDYSPGCYHVFYHPSGTGLTSAAILDGVTITDGNADGTGDHLFGGGMYNDGCSPTLNNVTFISNDASYGGAMCNNQSADPTITNSSFINNTATNEGGAIYNNNTSSASVTSTTFTQNQAHYGGAVSTKNSSNIEIGNSLITSNTASSQGGAFYLSGSTYTITNTTFSSNEATDDGGGIAVIGGSLTCNNCIIWENSAGRDGNEIFMNSSATAATLNYSCYSNGTDDVVDETGTFDATNNCTTENPKFVDAAGDDYTLHGTSPCVDTGNNTYNSESEDLRGQTRVQDGTIDMGCYEWTYPIDPSVKIIYVDDDASGDDDGQNWTDAYTSFQNALDEATSGDEIWVADGTYYPTTEVGGTGSRYQAFQMVEGVEIYGGFAGTESAVSERTGFGPGETNETILSGDIGTQGNNSDNCYHVFYHPDGLGLTSAAVLNGFTITGGNADSSTPHSLGGGIHNINNSPTLENLNLISNSAYGGGGIYNQNSSSTITNVYITSNSAQFGGGIRNYEASPVITNALIVSNSVTEDGAGVYNSWYSSPTLTNVTITGNSADDEGGGLYNDFDGLPVLNNCIVWGNSAATNGNQFYIKTATVTLNYSCYSNGTGDVYDNSGNGTLTATNSITNNPMFVSPTNSDYRLLGTSPCVDTGNNSYNSETYDLRGEDRIQNTTIDMGCYEYTSGTDPAAAIIYVDADQPDDNDDGYSWATAKNSLQAALDLAYSGYQIWIADGYYYPTTSVGGTGTRYYAFQMVEGVEIYGGFAGTESAVSERSDYGYGNTNETILSGNLGSPSSTDDNCYHVFYNTSSLGLTNDAVLDGVTITGGNANGADINSHEAKGGGMFIDGSPTLNNVAIISNSAVYGGGLYVDESLPIVTNALIASNTATYNGAGICNNFAAPTLNNATIVGNTAGTNGGGLYNLKRNDHGTTTLNNCIVWGNSANNDGNQLWTHSIEVDLNYSCYSNGSGDVYEYPSTYITANNSITSNPKFVDAPNGDYTLYGNSPCVDTGNNSYNSETYDLRGEDRVQNTTIDMGCYEYTSGTDPANCIVYVDADGGNDSNNGLSWGAAKQTLQAALEYVTSGDQIWVAAGTYKPTSPWDETVDGDRDFHFRMVEGVEIYGGFAGTESAVSERTSFGHGETNETILSGDIGTEGDNSDNCYHVFYHPDGLGLTSAAVLDGFTITGGNANYTTGSLDYKHYNGGGIYNDHNSPSFTNVTIVSNTTAGKAGGIHNYYSSPSITNSKIISNTADNWGGGMYNGYSSSPSIANTLIASNTGMGGGGIFNRSSSHPVLTNTTIVENLSTNDGGGIENHDVQLAYSTLNNCIIWGNTAYNDGDQICTSNNVTMNNCCYANQSGDITGTPTVSNCTTANPKFVDAPNDDYTLYGNSPCVNTGEDSYNSETYDLRGEDRVQNFTIDMGCYEYTSGTDPENSIIYVDANSGNDSNNGFSWGNAKQTLQAGLDLAYDGDQVWVASGTYTPSSAYDLAETGDRDYHFRMIEGVAIYGGFAGTESAVSERTGFGPGGTNETTLSGDIGTGGDDSDNCYHVLYNPDGLGLTSAAVLDGFTITGGNADGSAPHSSGGGIYNDNNSPTLENLNLTSNSALGGGGIYISNSSPTITNVYLTSNNAMSGGGMRNYHSSPVITNALIASNTVTHDGAGVYNSHSTPTLTNVTIAGNTAADEGGGLYNYVDGLPVLNNCIVWGNSATYGKQFYIHTATVTLDYTCYSNGTGDVNDNSGTGTLTATNSITNNPKFNDAAGGDYTLYGTSPCVDSGSDAHNSETTDLRGQARKQSTIDMGAYEWTSGTDPDFAIIYADADQADDSGDGLSWATAKQTLQAALDMAVAGEQVWVAAGTYTPTTNTVYGAGSRYKTFQMIEGAAIYGGFDGTETEVSQRDNFGVGEANETILSGDIGTVGNNSDNCYNVFCHIDGYGLTNSAILDGFTITGGNANGSWWYDMIGGGMINENNSPTIRNVAFVNNRAFEAGGMCCENASPNLSNVTFTNNSAYSMNAGALYIDGGSPQITNCSFTGNSSNKNGGAIYISSSSTVITNALICDNTTGEMGGGIYISSSPVFNNATISNNSTTGTGTYDGGGGIYFASGSDADFNNCIIYGNQAANNQGHQISLTGYSTAKGTLNYCCYSNGSNDTYDDWYLTTTNNNITSNPQFVDAGNSDYRVYGNSPCVDTGNNSYNSETTDIRGQARKQSTIDMGAYEWTSGVDPFYPVATWTGNTSTAWNIAGNWDIAQVPGASNDVTIPDVSNDPIVSSAESCNNLTIESGAVLTIDPGGTLSVDGTLTNNAGNDGLLLQSTVSGTGKLKNNTVGVPAKVQQYLVANQWHYMGIPFTGSHNADAAFPGLWAMSNNEASASDGSESGWAYLDDLDQVSAGNGYAIYHDLDTNFMMLGTLVTGEKAVNTSFTNEGWNFIANPYPCTVDWGVVNSNLANVNNAIYVWDPTLNSGNGTYATYIDGTGTNGQTQYIAPMQGFFVKGNTGAGSVSFTNDAKTAEASTFKSESLQSIIRLATSDANGFEDETVIRIKTTATNGFDGQMDAYKLKANTLTPQLYSAYNGDEYSINSIPQVDEELIIPLELMVKTNGEHTVALSELSNYNYPYPLILKNPATGETVNLQSENYHFEASEGETVSLQLGFSNSTVSSDEWLRNNLYLWSENQSIVVSSMGNIASEVAVLNASGQVVYRANVQTNELWIPVSTTGMYIVRVKPENGAVYNGKVVVR